MKEKLIDLFCTKRIIMPVAEFADYLIANNVVVVIRCKDCGNAKLCKFIGDYRGDEGYCSLSKPKNTVD